MRKPSEKASLFQENNLIFIQGENKKMKKKVLAMLLTGCLALSFSMTAFAGSWQSNATGKWWQRDDGSWPANCWEWIDDNGDGKEEMYYFDANGYLLTNTYAPDGKYINANGQWETEGYVHQEDGDVPDLVINGVSYGLDEIGENAITWLTSDVMTGKYDLVGYEGLMADAANLVVGYPKAVQERFCWYMSTVWESRITNGLWTE